MRGQSMAALAAVVLLMAGAVTTPIDHAAPRSASSSSLATASIEVNATGDYGYQPDTFQDLPLDANITVTFTDYSDLQHSFTISSREGFEIPTNDTSTQLAHFLATYPPRLSLLVNGTGDQAVGNFTSPPTAGWYEFVCNVSGHFQNGMYGFIAFGESLPSNLTPPSRIGLGGGSFTPVDAVVTGGLVVLIVLGVVVWRRQRSPPQMP
jgi:uncharacterized cupredoxin-like copper-binding protein